jgi:uncharacterized membrane protein YjgN (DUF898 family)
MSTSPGRLLVAAVVAIVGLFLLWFVVYPIVKFLISMLVTIAIFGAVIWLVYKVLTYDADKSSS